MYSLIKPLLFQLEPEKSHDFALASLSMIHKLGLNALLASKVTDSP